MVRKNKITSHKIRDLLKTILLVCGVSEHVAGQIIGYKSRDSYVKTNRLYPDQLRNEYSKASRMLNIFSHAENTVKNPESSSDIDEKLQKSENNVEQLLKRVSELESEKSNNSNMNIKIEGLTNILMEILENTSDIDLKNKIKEKLDSL